MKVDKIQRDIFNKLMNGGITVENPLCEPALELQDVIMFLKQNKRKVPKILEEFAEEVYQEHLKWKPF